MTVNDFRAIGAESLPAFIDVGRGWQPTEVTHVKVKLALPSAVGPMMTVETLEYPEKETPRFLQWTSKAWRSDMATNTIDFTKMELGKVTRTFKGRPVACITRCVKCGERGERSVFIPEKRSGARPYVSWHHAGHTVNAVAGFSYFSVDKSCTAKLSVENSDDLLNRQELKEYDAWRADMHAFIDGTEPVKPESRTSSPQPDRREAE